MTCTKSSYIAESPSSSTCDSGICVPTEATLAFCLLMVNGVMFLLACFLRWAWHSLQSRQMKVGKRPMIPAIRRMYSHGSHSKSTFWLGEQAKSSELLHCISDLFHYVLWMWGSYSTFSWPNQIFPDFFFNEWCHIIVRYCPFNDQNRKIIWPKYNLNYTCLPLNLAPLALSVCSSLWLKFNSFLNEALIQLHS